MKRLKTVLCRDAVSDPLFYVEPKSLRRRTSSVLI